MPIIKTYQVRYFCETDNAYFHEEQQDSVAMPSACPNAHTWAALRDLVILKESMEIT